MHGQLKIALQEVLKGSLQQLLQEAEPFESCSKKGFGSISCATSLQYPSNGGLVYVRSLTFRKTNTMKQQRRKDAGQAASLGSPCRL